jgi:hypothetical protein
MIIACQRNPNPEIVSFLLKAGADVNRKRFVCI